ncbi:MAG: 50S ribosomal protein L28 [bacterium]|nr:50S ribosomal protein L28 [bacterium]MCP5069087.1 50S ribosomal protein L28 [bacterium]
MPKRCQLTGVGPRAGRNVAHSHVKTCRRFDPNLQKVHLQSEALGRRVALRITTRALRTVQKHGGLDPFLLKMDDRKLAPDAMRLKRSVQKALS